MHDQGKGQRVKVTISKGHSAVLEAIASKHKVSVIWLAGYTTTQLIDRGGEELSLPLEFS